MITIIIIFVLINIIQLRRRSYVTESEYYSKSLTFTLFVL